MATVRARVGRTNFATLKLEARGTKETMKKGCDALWRDSKDYLVVAD